MHRSNGWIVIAVLALAAVVAAAGFLTSTPDQAVEARISVAVADATGFERADGPRPLTFPEAHGPHPDFQTEWWYFTGNLSDDAGNRYGYQFTIFRRALTPPGDRAERASDWSADQVYMAHFTLTDASRDSHQAFERYSRGAAGLAGAQAAPFSVWLEDWQVTEVDTDTWHISAAQDGYQLELDVTRTKPPALQGDQGYSQKGEAPGNASYYYSLTRMASVGTLIFDGYQAAVEGWSWMDHEYSTSALSEGQIGWDWFSLQLDDNTEIMLYYVRREDGSVDPLSKGSFITSDGETNLITYAGGDFRIEVLDTWTSDYSGGRYPVEWRVTLPGQDLDLTITALVDAQENTLSFAYWEGAVEISGSRDGEIISGYGYVEMTGYATSMAGQF